MGPIPLGHVIGRVILIDTGGSFTRPRSPQAFAAHGLAPPDTRWIVPATAAVLAISGLLALVVLMVFGVIRFAIRRRRSRGVVAGPSARVAR
jgi:hypothetical protein